MTDDATFEQRYGQWREACAATRATLRSDDAGCVETPEFAAIVALGPEAVPAILDRLARDREAHLLIHALEQITGERLDPAVLDAARRRVGGPLGNQDIAALWRVRLQREDD
jgi:hypothetical protein